MLDMYICISVSQTCDTLSFWGVYSNPQIDPKVENHWKPGNMRQISLNYHAGTTFRHLLLIRYSYIIYPYISHQIP